MIGDIVVARYPFTDLSEIKPRPAVILAEVGTLDCIVCEVTSSSIVHPRRIEIASRDLQNGRLEHRSWARPDRLFTLHESVFRHTGTRLSDAKLTEILAATRALFQPPGGRKAEV